MVSKMEAELAAVRAELDGLKPKPAPPAPVHTGIQVVLRYGRTYWLTDPTPGPGTRAVGDGDPAAASLLGRAGIETPVDAGLVPWLKHLGVEFEELR
jgi:hypothetical protein